MNTEPDKNDKTTTLDAKATERVQATSQDISAAFGDAVVQEGADGDGSTAAAGDVSTSKQSHADSVYNGRLGAAMRENNELKRQIAELKRRTEELEAAGRGASQNGDGDGSGGDDGDDNFFDDETRKGIAKIVDARTRRYEDRIGQLNDELDAYRAGAKRKAFEATQARSAEVVESRFPGLLHDIAGNLRNAWRQFCAQPDPITGLTFGQSLHEATQRGADAAAIRVFEEFVKSDDLAGRYETGAYDTPPSRSPNPASPLSGRGGAGGGRSVWPNRAAILAAMEKVQIDERRGTIDRAERTRRMNELDEALRSGRYLQ